MIAKNAFGIAAVPQDPRRCSFPVKRRSLFEDPDKLLEVGGFMNALDDGMEMVWHKAVGEYREPSRVGCTQ